MSYPSPPRRLQRSRNDRMIGGVCGGLAEYLNMDPTLVRVLAVIIALVTAAFPVIAIYLVLMLVLPEARPDQPGPPLTYQPPQQPTWNRQAEDPVWGASGPPWSPQQQADTPPPPPRQSTEDLFSRAKNVNKPSEPTKPADPNPGADSNQTPS